MRLRFDRRVLLMALAGGLPAVVFAMAVLWRGGYPGRVSWTLTIVLLGCWWAAAAALTRRVVFPLQTLSNILAGLREGDSSLRVREAAVEDPLGHVMLEANLLSDTIRFQRLDALEATALLRKVMAEIDVAVFTFDSAERLRLVNRAGQRLLAQPSERLLNRTASDLGLASCLQQRTPRVMEAAFPGGSGRWEVRRTSFRQGGLPHHLLVLTDVSGPLREEERQAWQRLMRVLGHEINNSLAPIKSIARSLETLVSRDRLPDDWRADAHRGLSVIASRADSLGRFTAAYARLARLPRPEFAPLELEPIVRRVASLETRLPIEVRAVGPPVHVQADQDQIEQLLINLLRNAVDASLETGGGVSVTCARAPGHVEVAVTDEGPGIASTANLFVPFFTTKPGGSGIGLVLSRQIAEAHGGSLALENRTDRSGCVARLRLPFPVVFFNTV